MHTYTYLGTLYEGAPTQLQHLVNDKKGNKEDVVRSVLILVYLFMFSDSERLKMS